MKDNLWQINIRIVKLIIYQVKEKYDKYSLNSVVHYTLNVWSWGETVSFVFPRVPMFPERKSRETSGLEGKQN